VEEHAEEDQRQHDGVAATSTAPSLSHGSSTVLSLSQARGKEAS
jgi:hypothetical protein